MGQKFRRHHRIRSDLYTTPIGAVRGVLLHLREGHGGGHGRRGRHCSRRLLLFRHHSGGGGGGGSTVFPTVHLRGGMEDRKGRGGMRGGGKRGFVFPIPQRRAATSYPVAASRGSRRSAQRVRVRCTRRVMGPFPPSPPSPSASGKARRRVFAVTLALLARFRRLVPAVGWDGQWRLRMRGIAHCTPTVATVLGHFLTSFLQRWRTDRGWLWGCMGARRTWTVRLWGRNGGGGGRWGWWWRRWRQRNRMRKGGK